MLYLFLLKIIIFILNNTNFAAAKPIAKKRASKPLVPMFVVFSIRYGIVPIEFPLL